MDIITKLLSRAELLHERGQIKMLGLTLDEIDKRAEQTPLEEDQLQRYLRLDKAHTSGSKANPEDEKCHKCGGTGQYFNNGGPNGHCFACVGKGWQSERDKVREANYYARKQNHQALAYDPGF